MRYFITLLEGIMSFISPCMLPMLPIYISYFARDNSQKSRALMRSLFFVLGFTLMFCLMGLFAGTVGTLLRRHQTAINVVTGGIVVLFGLNCLGLIRLPFFKGVGVGRKAESLFSSFLFGLVYSVSLTPCVGAFLGSALMLAANTSTAGSGFLLLLTYSLGLGLPFLLSALLVDELQGAFSYIKAHYRVINSFCGLFLILVGICMACGWLNCLLALFS